MYQANAPTLLSGAPVSNVPLGDVAHLAAVVLHARIRNDRWAPDHVRTPHDLPSAPVSVPWRGAGQIMGSSPFTNIHQRSLHYSPAFTCLFTIPS